MQKNIITIGASLLVGLVLGYFLWGNSAPEYSNVHRMPDGSMMQNMQTNNQSNDMASMMANMNAGLQGKTGDSFDKEFLSEMIVHHQGAVDMAKQVLVTSKKPELLKLAQDIIFAQNGEIQMMQGWQKSWFK